VRLPFRLTAQPLSITCMFSLSNSLLHSARVILFLIGEASIKVVPLSCFAITNLSFQKGYGSLQVFSVCHLFLPVPRTTFFSQVCEKYHCSSTWRVSRRTLKRVGRI
jgi:hypothetical protein